MPVTAGTEGCRKPLFLFPQPLRTGLGLSKPTAARGLIAEELLTTRPGLSLLGGRVRESVPLQGKHLGKRVSVLSWVNSPIGETGHFRESFMHGREKELSKPKHLLWALSILNQADQETVQANSCSEGGPVAPLPRTCLPQEASSKPITLWQCQAWQCQAQQCWQRSLDICRDAQRAPWWSLFQGERWPGLPVL